MQPWLLSDWRWSCSASRHAVVVPRARRAARCTAPTPPSAELDPTIAYTAEGLTAMYNTYLPLLTYAHANGKAGTKVVPALAESLPKITDGGKTYTLTLRKGLKYSDGTPVKASDFASYDRTHLQAQLARLLLLHGHRRRRKVRRNQARRDPGDRDRRQDRRDRHPPDASRGAPSPTSWRCSTPPSFPATRRRRT